MGLPQNHRRAPTAIDERSSTAALRAIAVLEATKGALVVLIAAGLLTLLHRDVPGTVEHLLTHLHIHSDRRIGRALIDAFAHVTDGRLWTIAGACLLYKSRQLERRMDALLRATQQAHPSKAPPNASAR